MDIHNILIAIKLKWIFCNNITLEVFGCIEEKKVYLLDDHNWRCGHKFVFIIVLFTSEHCSG